MDTSRVLPSGYSLRAPRLDEAAVIDRLSATCDEAVGAPPSLSEDFIRAFWSRPRFVLETDAWVVEQGQDVVGYAEVWDEHPTHLSAFAIVHPEHLGRGIGSALAALIEARAAEKASGDARLFSSVITQDEVGARLLRQRGYEWARRFWHMEVEMDGPAPAPTPSPGIELRGLDPARDLPTAHRVINETFADHWNYSATSYDDFLAENVEGDDFDPDLWIIASDAGEPVGILHGVAHNDRGWIYEVGVLRSHRGRGIASALLRASIAEFSRRGLPRVRLNVDSESLTGAVRLYERVGMEVVTSYDLWARPVPRS